MGRGAVLERVPSRRGAIGQQSLDVFQDDQAGLVDFSGEKMQADHRPVGRNSPRFDRRIDAGMNAPGILLIGFSCTAQAWRSRPRT